MKEQSTTQTQKPTHQVYIVNGEGRKATWTRVGVCWPHKDAKGFSVSTDAIPLPVRFVIREIAERDMEEGAAA